MFETIKNIIYIIKEYVIPLLTIILAIYTFVNEKEQRKLNKKVSSLELFIKEHEASEIKNKLNEDTEPIVTCKVKNISKQKYSLEFANLGKTRAFNINAKIPEEYNIPIFGSKLPYDYLDPEDTFEERIGVYLQSHAKFKVSISWENVEGQKFKVEELKSI